MSTIIYEKIDDIGYVTLNRPEELNAMNDEMLAEIDRIVAEYNDLYDVAPELRKGGDRHDALRYAARQEAALHIGFTLEGEARQAPLDEAGDQSLKFIRRQGRQRTDVHGLGILRNGG